MISPEFVAVIIQADMLICVALHHSRKDPAAFTLQAYKWYRPDYTLCSKNTVYSISYISDSIRDFLKSNKLEHAFILLGFCSQVLYENFYCIDRDAQCLLQLSPEDTSLVWNSCVLDMALEKSSQAFYYLYGLKRSQILQFQIAALLAPFNCIFITSVARALLQLLWMIQGNKTVFQAVIDNTLDFKLLFPSFITLLNHKKNTQDQYAQEELEVLCIAMGLHLLGEHYESF